MPDQANSGILDRDEATQLVQKNFSTQLVLLHDLTNFGTNLIPRAYNSGKKDLGDAMAVGVLLRQVVAMLDAFEVLVRAGAIHAAHLPGRAAFEASLFLEWMLVSDLEKKAKYYYVSNLRHDRMWAKRCILGSSENQAFSQITAQLNTDLNKTRPTLSAESGKQLLDIDRVLGQPELRDVDRDFEARRKKSTREVNWYVPLGASTLRMIAKTLNRLPEYELLYAKGSQVTHSSTYKDAIRLVGNRLTFKGVRNLEGISALFNLVVAATYRSYEAVIRYYRPAELASFHRRYVTEWRGPFLSVLEIVYNYES